MSNQSNETENNKNIQMETKDGRSVMFQHTIAESDQALVINERGAKEVIHYSQLIVKNPCNKNLVNAFA